MKLKLNEVLGLIIASVIGGILPFFFFAVFNDPAASLLVALNPLFFLLHSVLALLQQLCSQEVTTIAVMNCRDDMLMVYFAITWAIFGMVIMVMSQYVFKRFRKR